jgi:hypothetical protein
VNPLHFWAEPYRWPQDPAGYVFLARAVEAIGRARFGEEWAGKEVTTQFVQPLPSRETASASDRVHAHQILMRHHPEYVRMRELEAAELRARDGKSGSTASLPPSLNRLAPPLVAEIPSYVRAKGWSAEWWSAAQAAVRREQEAQLPLVQRLGTVQHEIVRGCESGELVSAIRAKAGGKMEIVPRRWWNTESWRNRFVMCQLKPSEPFGLGCTGEKYCWIFLASESLDKYLNGQPFAPVAANIDVHLSPYMKTMLAVAKRLNITAENQPKLEVVKAELRRCWTGSEPLSDRLLTAAATLLREPESQLGRAKKRRTAD